MPCHTDAASVSGKALGDQCVRCLTAGGAGDHDAAQEAKEPALGEDPGVGSGSQQRVGQGMQLQTQRERSCMLRQLVLGMDQA